nr:MAG TPA: hypothetical protein [Caudoviricetes sp.]
MFHDKRQDVAASALHFEGYRNALECVVDFVVGHANPVVWWLKRSEASILAWRWFASSCDVSSLEKVVFRGIPGFLNVGEQQ